MEISLAAIAKMIDHSLLHPTMTDVELRQGCELARRLDVAAVCIKPYAVAGAAELLRGSGVAVGTVVGFPHGNSHIAIKVREAELACQEGATELDVVVNIGRALGGDWDYVSAEITALTTTAHKHGAIIKVIFENDYLPADDLKIRLCEICAGAGADFVKTSTGYGFVKGADGTYAYQGATDHDLQLMRAHCPPSVQVKARAACARSTTSCACVLWVSPAWARPRPRRSWPRRGAAVLNDGDCLGIWNPWALQGPCPHRR